MFVALLAVLGFGTAAGLNAYLPLLILALADRFSSAVDLPGPWDALSSGPGIVVLLLILPVELIGDKIAGLDRLNDRLHTFVRPVAGAIAGGAIADADGSGLMTITGATIGALAAVAISRFKVVQRQRITAATHGLGNPLVSMVEDGVAILNGLIAVFLPWGLLVSLPITLWGLRSTMTALARGGGVFARLAAAESSHIASDRLK